MGCRVSKVQEDVQVNAIRSVSISKNTGTQKDPSGPRLRPSLESLQTEYLSGNQKPLQDLMLAFKGIKDLAANHPHSYHKISSFHGYGIDFSENKPIPKSESDFPFTHNICPHSTVIFPTWHRCYILRLEKALQFINKDVMMPYWDQLSEETLAKGIPWALTQAKVKFGDEMMDNPLCSFQHPYNLRDPRNKTIYKPAQVNTVRFPLCGSYFDHYPDDVNAYNKNFQDAEQNVKALNEYLVQYVLADAEKDWKACLKVEKYDNFSNTRSVGPKETSLEGPHNTIHAAVGSVQFFIPKSETDQYELASGDMASVPLAAFDPIFYFHHCFVDRMFWEWQTRHNTTSSIPMVGNQTYNLKTPLKPFKKNDKDFYTSADCASIESLGYTYPAFTISSANKEQRRALRSAGPEKSLFSKKVLSVSGIDRSKIRGTFVIEAYARVEIHGAKYYLGRHTVFSRFDLENCENCIQTLDITAHFPLKNIMIAHEAHLSFTAKLKFKKGVSFKTLGIQPNFIVVENI